MANRFDVLTSPTTEPTVIIPGDYLVWRRPDLVADYPPAEYSAEYVARITGGGEDEIKLAQAAGTTADYFLFVVDSTTSAAFSVGVYHWQLEITQTASGNRIAIETGNFTARADMDSNQADPRSHARKMLTSIEQVLEGRATAEEIDAVQTTIGDRSMTRQGLLQMHQYYARLVAEERAAIRRASGKGGTGLVQVRFG